MTPGDEVAETATLPAQPASVSVARRFVRRFALEHLGDDVLVEDAALVVSELVANAVLHAGGPIVVTVGFRRTPKPSLRLDVADASPVPPVLREYGTGASTGRGLALVARLVERWGTDPRKATIGGVDRAVGKVVWAELTGNTAPELRPPAISVDDRQPGMDRRSLRPVVFLGVPVDLYRRLLEQNDAVLRELELLAFTADHSGHVDPSPSLGEVIERSRRFFDLTREGMRREVMAATERGEAVTDLHAGLETSSLTLAVELVALFEDAEELSARGELLVAPPSDAVRRLRRWIVSEMSRQLLEDESPQPFAT